MWQPLSDLIIPWCLTMPGNPEPPTRERAEEIAAAWDGYFASIGLSCGCCQADMWHTLMYYRAVRGSHKLLPPENGAWRDEMKQIPDDKIAAMDRDDAAGQVRNAVYAATQLIEQLETAGKLSGHGHHIRQGIAEAAKEAVKSHWIEPKVG